MHQEIRLGEGGRAVDEHLNLFGGAGVGAADRPLPAVSGLCSKVRDTHMQLKLRIVVCNFRLLAFNLSELSTSSGFNRKDFIVCAGICLCLWNMFMIITNKLLPWSHCHQVHANYRPCY